MLKTFKLISASIVVCSLLAGCASQKMQVASIDDVDFSKSKIKNMDTFEVNLLRIATKAEQHQKDYYSLLEKRKNLYDEKLKLHVPAGMGKNVDINFEGKVGELIQNVGSQAGYTVEFKNMNVSDTPMTAVTYMRTSLWDILMMTMAKVPEYGVDVKENERQLLVYPKY